MKRGYQIRHWIPMFIGTPCTMGAWNLEIPEKFVSLRNHLLSSKLLIKIVGVDLYQKLSPLHQPPTPSPRYRYKEKLYFHWRAYFCYYGNPKSMVLLLIISSKRKFLTKNILTVTCVFMMLNFSIFKVYLLTISFIWKLYRAGNFRMVDIRLT